MKRELSLKKLSAFVHYHIRLLIPNTPTFVKDTTPYLNIIKDTQRKPTNILFTLDVNAFYTNIPHPGCVAVNNRIIRRKQTLPFTENIYVWTCLSHTDKE